MIDKPTPTAPSATIIQLDAEPTPEVVITPAPVELPTPPQDPQS